MQGNFTRITHVSKNSFFKTLRFLVFILVLFLFANTCGMNQSPRIKGIFQLQTATRVLSNNSDLSNLTISSGTLSPVFVSSTTAYSASVSNATTTLTVTPTVLDSTSLVTVNAVSVVSGTASSDINLSVGVNTISIVVTAQDTSTKTYTLTVTRVLSNNSDLSNLTISSGTLSPVFVSSTTAYAASVSNATTTLTVTPTVLDSSSLVTVNAVSVTSGTTSSNINLNVGVNTISIIVTAQDTSTKTYTLTVTRVLSNINDLSGLTISQGTLYPVFSAATTSYLITLSSGTASMTVTPTALDPLATIKVNGITVLSGSATGNIPLVTGSNSISIVVTAQDGTTKTYSLDAVVVTNFLVKVNVTGLSGNLTVTNNADSLSLNTNGTFTFPTSIPNGNSYAVEITSKPTAQFCAITSAPNNNLPYGNISADVTISIQCETGYLYNGTVYQTFPIPSIPSLNQLTTMAGAYPTSTTGNTDATGTAARFDNPIAIATDGANIYVADIFNNAIRKVKIADNSVTTLATSTGPHGIATDGIYVYVTSFNTHVINRVPVGGGAVQTIAGVLNTSGNINNQGTLARFDTPTYLTTDGKNVYITDRGNNQIRKYSIATGVVTTLVTGLNAPNGITNDGNYLYIANTSANNIMRYDLNLGGAATVFATGFNAPYGLAMDGSNLYVFEGTGKTIKKIIIATVSVSTLISSVGYTDGNLGTTAQICVAASPCDSSMTTDGIFLYIADRHNNSIRKIGP